MVFVVAEDDKARETMQIAHKWDECSSLTLRPRRSEGSEASVCTHINISDSVYFESLNNDLCGFFFPKTQGP